MKNERREHERERGMLGSIGTELKERMQRSSLHRGVQTLAVAIAFPFPKPPPLSENAACLKFPRGPRMSTNDGFDQNVRIVTSDNG